MKTGKSFQEKIKLKPRQSGIVLWAILGAMLALSFLASLSVGDFKLSFAEIFSGLLAGRENPTSLILWDLRLPRALLGLLVGASLGLSGAAMQGLLRNPLAEPGVMGVTGGAVFGAVLVFYSGCYGVFSISLPLAGMAGALLTVLVIYLLAGQTSSIQTLILAGVAVNTLAFSATALALNLSSNPYAVLEIVYWQLGSLADRSFVHVGLASPFILAGSLLLLWDARALNALSLGEETALSMGIPLTKVRLRIILGTAMAVGASVSVTGNIGFVGLVVPHLLRVFVKNEPGRLLGVSAAAGAILLLLADTAVRLIAVGPELKLGVLTSLIGAPFFLFVIIKTRRMLS